MSNQQKLNHAASVIKNRLNELRQEIGSLPQGGERAAKEAEATALLMSVGMEGVQIVATPVVDATDADAMAASIAAHVNSATEAAANLTQNAQPAEIDVTVKAEDGSTTTSHTTISTQPPSLWVCIKRWVSVNRFKVVAGGLTLVAGAAGLYAWLRGRGVVPAVSSVADVEVVQPTVTPSLLTRLGDWVVGMIGAAKSRLLAAWAWLQQRFTRTENTVEIIEPLPQTA